MRAKFTSWCTELVQKLLLKKKIEKSAEKTELSVKILIKMQEKFRKNREKQNFNKNAILPTLQFSKFPFLNIVHFTKI